MPACAHWCSSCPVALPAAVETTVVTALHSCCCQVVTPLSVDVRLLSGGQGDVIIERWVQCMHHWDPASASSSGRNWYQPHPSATGDRSDASGAHWRVPPAVLNGGVRSESYSESESLIAATRKTAGVFCWDTSFLDSLSGDEAEVHAAVASRLWYYHSAMTGQCCLLLRSPSIMGDTTLSAVVLAGVLSRPEYLFKRSTVTFSQRRLVVVREQWLEPGLITLEVRSRCVNVVDCG